MPVSRDFVGDHVWDDRTNMSATYFGAPKLNANFVKSTRKVGRHGDGNGLYLVVDPSGARRWIVRTVIRGRRREAGLGSAKLVSLGEARAKAVEIRRAAREGRDPIFERRKQIIQVPSFREAAERLFAERRASFRSSKHAAQWISTLRIYAYPAVGDLPVDKITAGDVHKVLQPIWHTKAETAKRLKQRLGKVFEWSKAHQYVQGDNVALSVDGLLAPQKRIAKNHRSVPYDQIRDFIIQLEASSASRQVKIGLQIIILTALRTSEVQRARWEEVDWEKATWTIPAERQLKKSKPTPHLVPLAPQVIELLRELKEIAGSSVWMFPGHPRSRPISNMTFLTALKRLGRTETVHGFRSTFRTWVDEELEDDMRLAAEQALAHSSGGKIEAAYRRGAMLEKRRRLMAAWASYACRQRI